jgi:hypothetical protein
MLMINIKVPSISIIIIKLYNTTSDLYKGAGKIIEARSSLNFIIDKNVRPETTFRRVEKK